MFRLFIVLSVALLPFLAYSNEMNQSAWNYAYKAAVFGDDKAFIKQINAHPEIVDYKDKEGNTLLHFIPQKDSYDGDSFENGTRRFRMLKALVDNGADVNIKNDRGETPLMKAAHWSRLASIRLLLKHNADATMLDDSGLSVLHHFAKFGVSYFELDYVSYPGENDGGNQFIVFFKAIANELIQKGADLSIKSASGETALDIAHKNNRDDIAAALSQLTKT